MAAAIEASRRKLGFLFLGYGLMPDHWHALILPVFPLTLSRAIIVSCVTEKPTAPKVAAATRGYELTKIQAQTCFGGLRFVPH